MAEAKGLQGSLQVGGEVSVLGDRLRLKQLLLNLADNAVKYTPAGGTVDLGVDREEGWARVTVEDRGVGIPEEDLSYIFDRFYQVEKARSLDDTGGGLGLSICQWITQAHGGKITVRSRVGYGSAFIVALPVACSS
jgi:signal transduction histidine kinase